MNASPVSASNSATPRSQTKAASKGRNWIYSLTGVCFIFGGLLATQLRTIQQVKINEQSEKDSIKQVQARNDQLRKEALASKANYKQQEEKIAALQVSLKNGAKLTGSQLAALNAQIKEMRSLAGLTPLSGRGISLTLSDSPDAGKVTTDTAFLPGLVHDYDLLQVVNELRAVKAEAIAISGAGGPSVRVTGYTPIRCVGPAIYVNWEPVAAPFTIEAVGDPKRMLSALKMANGIVDQLRTNGAIGVKISEHDKLTVPAAEGGATQVRVAKSMP